MARPRPLQFSAQAETISVISNFRTVESRGVSWLENLSINCIRFAGPCNINEARPPPISSLIVATPPPTPTHTSAMEAHTHPTNFRGLIDMHVSGWVGKCNFLVLLLLPTTAAFSNEFEIIPCYGPAICPSIYTPLKSPEIIWYAAQ